MFIVKKRNDGRASEVVAEEGNIFFEVLTFFFTLMTMAYRGEKRDSDERD